MRKFTDRYAKTSQLDMGFPRHDHLKSAGQKPAPVSQKSMSGGTDMNLYRMLVPNPETGEDDAVYWRGGANCADALELIRSKGISPVFLESLRGGEPGYWSAAESMLGISQSSMDL